MSPKETNKPDFQTNQPGQGEFNRHIANKKSTNHELTGLENKGNDIAIAWDNVLPDDFVIAMEETAKLLLFAEKAMDLTGWYKGKLTTLLKSTKREGKIPDF